MRKEKESKFLYKKCIFTSLGEISLNFSIFFLMFFCVFIGLKANAENSQEKLNQDGSNSNSVDFKIQNQIASMKNVQLVTLVIDRPYSEHVMSWDETTFRKFGCTYVTQEIDRVFEMLNILKEANIRSESSGVMQGQIREGVFLKLTNGEEVKFLFDQKFNRDEAVIGFFDGHAIYANSSLPEELYHWASKIENRTECDSFIGQYRDK